MSDGSQPAKEAPPRPRRAVRVLFVALVVGGLLLAGELGVRLATRLAWEARLDGAPEVEAQLERTRDAYERFGAYEAGSPLPAAGDEYATVLPREPEGSPRTIPFAQVTAADFPKPPSADAKAPGTIRIAMVGGSTTAVSGYAEDTERGLAERPGLPPVEVLNLGVSASYTETSLLLMRRFLPRWRPDYVVVYHGCNDLASYARTVPFRYERGEHGLFSWLWDQLTGGGYPREEVSRVVVARATAAYRAMAELVAGLGGQLVLSTFAAPSYDTLPARDREHFDLLFAVFRPEVRDSATYAALLADYNAAVRDLAAELKLPLVDVAAGLGGGREHFLDNCHRTPAGVRVHAALATGVLAELLGKRGR